VPVRFLRHALGLGRELATYTMRSGRWWVPVVLVVLSAATIVAVTTKAVVPVAVYALF